MTERKKRSTSKVSEVPENRHDPDPSDLPYGIFDLDPVIEMDAGPPHRIRCFIQNCVEYLIPPSRGRKGEVCPKHAICCHKSGTYSFPDIRLNAIVAKELFATKISGHPFKFESHRLGSERSEDALTFNVMRAFQEAGCLNYLGRYITGTDIEKEPRLFLWGIELTNDCLKPWDLLIAARKRFETRMPVKRPKTEPDIALNLPGEYLVLIEAKFCSPNTFYQDGPRKDAQSLTKQELLERYWDPTFRILDQKKAIEADMVFYQLWRNTVFAEWMAAADSPNTKPYFANLTRRGFENDSFQHFAEMVRSEFVGRICHFSWEDLWVLAGLSGDRLNVLREYLLTKTASLHPAFDLGLW